MSTNDDSHSQAGFDPNDHQTSYIFAPVCSHEEPRRPKKRRKMSKSKHGKEEAEISYERPFQFTSLLDGAEKSEFVERRQQLFQDFWGVIESRVQSILTSANEKTLTEVTSFVDTSFVDAGLREEHRDQIPTALIVTGPNNASQELMFSQVAGCLRSETNSIVIILRSMDASNLKTILKKLIRDATNQQGNDDDDLVQVTSSQNGRKLLNFDLQILQDHLELSHHSKVVVAVQDSEAFDSNLLAELVLLFSSWLDRIPFVMLLGIATSVELFHERLSAATVRCLYGAKFDVQETSETLDKIFQKVVAGSRVPLRLGHGFATFLLERQRDHVQSVQTFICALKYAYMCHFYANPLSILLAESPSLQREHFEAIRMLPSFQQMIETLLADGLKEDIEKARQLLDSDDSLFSEIQKTLRRTDSQVENVLRVVHILATASTVIGGEQSSGTDLYMKAFSGQLGDDSDITNDILLSIKSLTPSLMVELMRALVQLITEGDPASDLAPWNNGGHETFVDQLVQITWDIKNLINKAATSDTLLRSRYIVQSKTVRTTVVAQKVQLSREKSALSELDGLFTGLVDQTTDALRDYISLHLKTPQKSFLHEIWLYDLKSPNRETFTPRPRHAIERALSSPQDYLSCTCCKSSEEGLSSTQPPTAILYQLYLETGGLINVFDLWSAFFTIIGGEEGEDCDERTALILFYRGLADLKLLGMVKQSRKKTDHLAKLAWKGL